MTHVRGQDSGLGADTWASCHFLIASIVASRKFPATDSYSGSNFFYLKKQLLPPQVNIELTCVSSHVTTQHVPPFHARRSPDMLEGTIDSAGD